MKNRNAFTLVELLLVISIIALLIGLLFPALGAARRAARHMDNNTRVRGIHSAMLTFSQGNRGFYPGVKSNGTAVLGNDPDIDSGSPPDPAGDEIAVRYEILLDGGYFTGEAAISPADDDKTEWTTDAVDTNNYSYAMLRLEFESSAPYAFRQAVVRNNDWRESTNPQAIVICDRNETGDQPSDAADNRVSSIHTYKEGDWQGSVGWNDGAVEFEKNHKQSTKYSGGEFIDEDDNIFQEDDDSNPPPDDDAYMRYID